jgi:hypothetical protein
MTQFTAFRSANQTPVMEEEMLPSDDGQGVNGANMDDGVKGGERDQGVIRRMSAILELEADDPARPDVLDDPPRKLVLAMQVWQVVDENVSASFSGTGGRSTRPTRIPGFAVGVRAGRARS